MLFVSSPTEIIFIYNFGTSVEVLIYKYLEPCSKQAQNTSLRAAQSDHVSEAAKYNVLVWRKKLPRTHHTSDAAQHIRNK